MIEGISKNVPSSAKNQKKGNIGGVSSLMNFNTVGNSQMNNSFNQKNENVNQSPSSSYIDHSFENALKEARKNVIVNFANKSNSFFRKQQRQLILIKF